MEFTGERYLPTERGQIKYEHLHRYAVCWPLVAGRQVLDIACGEGYGAALLAKAAAAVTGVDLAPETIEHARKTYGSQTNLRFLTGDCRAIPLPDHSIEIVTSFETLEHHPYHEEMLREIKRVLVPNGLLILSSPNKLVYSDQANFQNPFHIKELYYEELLTLLARYFRHTRVFGQKLMTASFLFDLQARESATLNVIREAAVGWQQRWLPLSDPPYFLTLNSNAPIPPGPSLESLFLDNTDDLYQQMRAAWLADHREMEAQAQMLQARLTAAEKTISGIINSRAWQMVQKWWQLRSLFPSAPAGKD